MCFSSFPCGFDNDGNDRISKGKQNVFAFLLQSMFRFQCVFCTAPCCTKRFTVQNEYHHTQQSFKPLSLQLTFLREYKTARCWSAVIVLRSLYTFLYVHVKTFLSISLISLSPLVLLMMMMSSNWSHCQLLLSVSFELYQ